MLKIIGDEMICCAVIGCKNTAVRNLLCEACTLEIARVNQLRHIEIQAQNQILELLPDDMKQPIRDVRAWHWGRVMYFRHKAQHESQWESQKAFYNECADFHIKQVQTLNYFFESGDTAEKDYETKRKHSEPS